MAPNSITANRDLYTSLCDAYREHQPHLRHSDLHELHERCIDELMQGLRPCPTVLDLGAGDGASTQSFLTRGAVVTAVDLSEVQLQNLRARCGSAEGRLKTVCGDALASLQWLGTFDVVVASSFLHHVPDYVALVAQALDHVSPVGRFFSFQDPLRYDTLSRSTYAFSNGSYFAWRLFQGDLLRGLQTRIRRARGIYGPGRVEDDAEYHVTRNGVDQNRLADVARARGFAVRAIHYFSTQSSFLQRIGTQLGVANTFALIALRDDHS